MKCVMLFLQKEREKTDQRLSTRHGKEPKLEALLNEADEPMPCLFSLLLMG